MQGVQPNYNAGVFHKQSWIVLTECKSFIVRFWFWKDEKMTINSFTCVKHIKFCDLEHNFIEAKRVAWELKIAEYREVQSELLAIEHAP